jgi:hypothetical protein
MTGVESFTADLKVCSTQVPGVDANLFAGSGNEDE